CRATESHGWLSKQASIRARERGDPEPATTISPIKTFNWLETTYMKLTKWTSSLALALGMSVGMTGASIAQDTAPDVIRIGYALAKSGPNAPGADTTVRPNYEMWVKEVNDAGGLMLSAYGKRVPIEVVQYDDRSSTEEAVRAIERLVTQDKVDLLLPPWGTATNLAVAPLFMKYG